MLPFLEPAKRNVSYLFLAAGVLWLGALYATTSLLILWPAVACIASFLFLRFLPQERISYAWVLASGFLGFLLSGYQAYAAATFLGGPFASVAAVSLVLFFIFALYHLFLMYAGRVKPPEEEEE
ncbi:MAG TPA: hypothetical protein VLY21_06800 [Nitrososphaerales archaeon]|nr:hypothetical protein [Nitrososphaerales archaeon]